MALKIEKIGKEDINHQHHDDRDATLPHSMNMNIFCPPLHSHNNQSATSSASFIDGYNA